MKRHILYTSRSRETYISVYNFVKNKFGIKTAEKFKLKAEKTIELIAIYPFMFKATAHDEHVRIGFISKQTSLLYRITDNAVHILVFWDNRQDPIFLG